jgi:transcriptional regulator with XRE-family HTH domain
MVQKSKEVIIPGPGKLGRVRKRLGLSQETLARESGVTRSVIANYESGRTPKMTTFEDLLNIYRVLKVKERAFNESQEEKNTEAAEALLGLLWLKRESSRVQLAEIDGKLEALRRKREAAKRSMAEVKSEAKQLKMSIPSLKIE